MRKNNHKKQKPERTRQPRSTLNESFRRNTVVISSRQRELEQRQQSVTQRQVDKKRAVKKRRARNQLIAMLILVLLGIFFYRMRITDVSVTSNASSRLTDDKRLLYEEKVVSAMKENTIASQSWLIDSRQLSNDIIANNPEIERVTISSSNPIDTESKAEIRFRQPLFIWKDVGGETQFVDKHGVLFSKNLDPTVQTDTLTRIEDQSGIVLAAGSSVLTANLVELLGQLPDKLNRVYENNSSIERVIIPKSTREVQIQMKNVPYRIKFNSSRDVDQQIGELKTLQRYLTQKKIKPSQYIDLRVEHKAYYK